MASKIVTIHLNLLDRQVILCTVRPVPYICILKESLYLVKSLLHNFYIFILIKVDIFCTLKRDP
jgi:hypothetical protein